MIYTDDSNGLVCQRGFIISPSTDKQLSTLSSCSAFSREPCVYPYTHESAIGHACLQPALFMMFEGTGLLGSRERGLLAKSRVYQRVDYVLDLVSAHYQDLRRGFTDI